MFNLRLKYEKTGPCAYISHLDMMKTLQRSLVRSALPVKYSQGFNPHIYLSILAPLSTGFESIYELCDFALMEDLDKDECVKRLNEAFPQGIRAAEIYVSDRPLKDIEFGKYEILYERGNAEEMAEFMSQPRTVIKESKRQSKEINILDYIREISFEQLGDKVKCTAVVKMGNDDPLNPVYISKALSAGGFVLEDDTPRYKRIALLDKNLENFR